MDKLFNYTYLVYINNPESSLYGKVYYGKHSTNNLNDGYICSSLILQRYLKKYPNGYYRKILHLYNTKEELNKTEYDLIHPHLNKFYCLNLREGGEGGALSEESQRKQAEKLKGRKQPEEMIKKRALSNTGKKRTQETKDKISKALKGNSACGRPGHKETEETRKKISEAKKGNKNPMFGKDPWNKGISIGPLSEEHKKKISKGGKQRYLNHPEERKKISDRVKGENHPMFGKHHSEESKKKNAEKHKGISPPNKGKHLVWDNKELKKFHYE